MLVRCGVVLFLAYLLAACGDDTPLPVEPPSQAKPVTEVDMEAETRRLRAVLTELGIDAELGPMKHDTTKRLLAFPVDADKAFNTWKTLRDNRQKLGRWPLVVQATEDPLGTVDREDYPDGPAGVIEAAAEINAGLWLDEREREDREYYADAPVGSWKEVDPALAWSFVTDWKGRPNKGLVIALVPTLDPWEVCAWFFFGDWNECPPAAVHVATHQRWHRLYGAEIVFLSRDIIEMHCPRRPKDREEALALAREQFLYSGGDLIYQGVAGMRELASTLLGNSVWFFWWD